jgi:hypothetical protein
MQILFMMDSPMAFMSGIWTHRIEHPSKALEKRGHGIKQVAIGTEIPENLLTWPDVVVFGRSYASQYDPVKLMRQYKDRGKRVVYDMDDDFWNVSDDNPSVLVSNAHKDQYEGMIQEADIVISPSPVLLNKFKKHFKKKEAYLCPNGVDFDTYKERPHAHEDTLIVGYMGAASHWKDLQIIAEVVVELQRKHDFLFTIYGLTGEPLESAIYTYSKILAHKFQPEKRAYHESALDFYKKMEGARMWHVPFMPPELHPKTLSMCDFDIGLAPLADNEFNRGKSNIKFYEYAAVGTVTLASDVVPYNTEVKQLAKNTEKDWKEKLERLIIDREYRAKVLAQQQEWVKKNRSLDAIGLDWELALQKKSGLFTRNQKR